MKANKFCANGFCPRSRPFASGREPLCGFQGAGPRRAQKSTEARKPPSKGCSTPLERPSVRFDAKLSIHFFGRSPRKAEAFYQLFPCLSRAVCAVCGDLTPLPPRDTLVKSTPVWWNGRHRGLKIPWERSRTGSSPVTGTKKCTRKGAFFGAAPAARADPLRSIRREGHTLPSRAHPMQTCNPVRICIRPAHHVRRTQLHSVSPVSVSAGKTACPLQYTKRSPSSKGWALLCVFLFTRRWIRCG